MFKKKKYCKFIYICILKVSSIVGEYASSLERKALNITAKQLLALAFLLQIYGWPGVCFLLLSHAHHLNQ